MHRDSEQVNQVNAYLSKMVNKRLKYSRDPGFLVLFFCIQGLNSDRHHRRYLPLPLH